MQRGFVRWVCGAGGAVLLVGALAACATASGDPKALPVPTFSSPTARADQVGGAGPAADKGVLPDDCARLLGTGDLGALLGLPLDSVVVRTTLGVPAPSVGRTERITCAYTGTADPVAGAPVLGLNLSAYVDPDAAEGQWRTNADAEDGPRRDLPIGTARAVLVERSTEVVLLVVHEAQTLTVVLPAGPGAEVRPAADTAVDVALRVLAKMVPTPPPPTVQPGPTQPPTARSPRAAGSGA